VRVRARAEVRGLRAYGDEVGQQKICTVLHYGLCITLWVNLQVLPRRSGCGSRVLQQLS